MMLPLLIAVPFVVLTGHPRGARLMQRLGLLRMPEDRARPRPLLRAEECTAFDDLKPAAADRPRAAQTRMPPSPRGLRLVSSGMAVSALAFALVSPGASIAPELPMTWRADRPLIAYMEDSQLSPAGADKPQRRKREPQPDRPARRIDDALRRRAIEAVERAMASPDAPWETPEGGQDPA
jgi:hypothetical protein